MVCPCHKCGLFAMTRTNHTLPTERSNAAAINCTVDLQSVRIFHGSVWFVRAIGFAYFLWHAQIIRFHEIFERSVNPLYSGFTDLGYRALCNIEFIVAYSYIICLGNYENCESKERLMS